MTKKRKQIHEEQGKTPKRVRIRLRPEAEERIAIPKKAAPPTLGISDLDNTLARFSVQRILIPRVLKYGRLTGMRRRWYVMEFPYDVDTVEIIDVLKNLPMIEDVELVELPDLNITPNDPTFGWHLTTIEAEDAWDISRGNGVSIGVVDTGVDRNHQDLNNHWDGGDNSISGNHGTNVAGICVAETNNNRGVAGVGFNTRLRGYDFAASGNAMDDIDKAVDAGVDVINMSWQYYEDHSSLEDAVEYAFKTGIVCVAAAGNAQKTIPYTAYPQAYDKYVISVGRTNNDDSRHGNSNYGNWLDVMAPGSCLPTTAPREEVPPNSGNWVDRYNNCFSGTSASAPVVAGIAALMKARNHTLGPRQVKEILRETTDLPAGTDTSNNRYGNGRVNASKALLATGGLWKTVRYGSVPKVGAAVAVSENGWWIVAYSKSVFVGYKTSYWRKMVYYNSVADAEPAVDINDNGDWIVNYSKSTFVGYRTSSAVKMVYYPRRNTPGAVAINQNGDWIAVYSKSTFVGYKTSSAAKMIYYNGVPGVPGDVAINANGDWICCYSKSTFVGYKTSSAVKKVYYNNVANAAAAVDINDNGDWIVNYSKSTFVGYKTSSASKMVYYPKRSIPGDVAINTNGDWICCYSRSTFVGYKRSSAIKRVYYNNVANAAAAVDINDNGDWIVNYSKSTFVGYKTSSASKMVYYPKRNVSGDVAINQNGDWIVVYSLSTFIGHKRSWASKRVYYNSVPKARGLVDINENGDWIVNYSRTTFVGRGTHSTIKAVKYASDDMSRDDILDGFSYPPSTLPGSHGAVAINNAGDWVASYSRSSSVGKEELYTNTHKF